MCFVGSRETRAGQRQTSRPLPSTLPNDRQRRRYHCRLKRGQSRCFPGPQGTPTASPVESCDTPAAYVSLTPWRVLGEHGSLRHCLLSACGAPATCPSVSADWCGRREGVGGQPPSSRALGNTHKTVNACERRIAGGWTDAGLTGECGECNAVRASRPWEAETQKKAPSQLPHRSSHSLATPKGGGARVPGLDCSFGGNARDCTWRQRGAAPARRSTAARGQTHFLSDLVGDVQGATHPPEGWRKRGVWTGKQLH